MGILMGSSRIGLPSPNTGHGAGRMRVIENDQIRVVISPKGAEVQSILYQPHEREYLWQGGDAWKNRFAPHLFPIVGALKDKRYSIDGKEYTLGQHGFARDALFQVTSQYDDTIEFSLGHSAATIADYPFQFSFDVGYELQGNKIIVYYDVTNLDNREILFSIGAHPGFRVPLVEGTVYEDHRIEFARDEELGRYPLGANGLLSPNKIPYLSGRVITLTRNTFNDGALVFDGVQSTTVKLLNSKNQHGVAMSWAKGAFPFLGLWAAKGGDFVCIEPWCGHADFEDHDGNLAKKDGIIALEVGGKFSRSYTIEIF